MYVHSYFCFFNLRNSELKYVYFADLLKSFQLFIVYVNFANYFSGISIAIYQIVCGLNRTNYTKLNYLIYNCFVI